MYEVEIEHPDGSKDTFESFDLATLMRSLDKCDILSFKIQLRQSRIAPNPFKKKKIEAMTAKEFFYLVAEMRAAQKAYFETRSRHVFRACRALENDVDREIRRVREILNEPNPTPPSAEDEP